MLTIGVGELLIFVMTRDPVTVTVVSVVELAGVDFFGLEFVCVDCGWAVSDCAAAAGACSKPRPIPLTHINNITRVLFVIDVPLCWYLAAGTQAFPVAY
jgi:hypothetical protein